MKKEEKAIKQAEKLLDDATGSFNSNTGEIGEAIMNATVKSMREIGEMYDKIDDKENSDYGRYLYNLALLNDLVGNKENAINLFKSSIYYISKRKGNEARELAVAIEHTAKAIVEYGELTIEKGKEANELYLVAVSIYQINKLDAKMADCYIAISKVCAKLKNYELAMDAINRASDLYSNESMLTPKNAEIERQLADILIEQREYARALKALDRVKINLEYNKCDLTEITNLIEEIKSKI